MNKEQYNKWLRKRGLLPSQVQLKRRALGSPVEFPDYSCKRTASLSNNIPSNGTKSFDMSKANFAKENYAMVPAYNKGPVMVVSKNDIAYAGKKI